MTLLELLSFRGFVSSHKTGVTDGDIMFLERIDISGFRGIRQLSIHLDPTTILIGENNTGKSSILDAVQMALGGSATSERAKFTEYDYHIATKDSRAYDGNLIEIVLHFSERANAEWPDNIIQRMGM